MLNKKGFTLVELLATIAIIGILSGIAIMAVTKYQQNARKELYSNYEKNLKSAATNYYTIHTGDIPASSESVTLDLNKLMEENLIESLSDPMDNSKKCDAYVTFTNNGNTGTGDQSSDMSQGLDENGNITKSNIKNLDLKYKVCLQCQYYNSKDCS